MHAKKNKTYHKLFFFLKKTRYDFCIFEKTWLYATHKKKLFIIILYIFCTFCKTLIDKKKHIFLK